MPDRRRPASTPSPRRAQLNLRVSAEERDALKQCAEEAGLDLVALIRKRLLGKADNMRPASPVEIVELRRCMAQIGRTGTDLHGLYRIAQLGEMPALPELSEVVTLHGEALRALMSALGRKA